MTQLYPISFLIALGALTGWYYFQTDERRGHFLRKLFFIAMGLFGVSWLAGEGEWSYKFLLLGREMLVLMVVPLFLGFFKKNKWVFLAMLFALLGAMDYFYFDRLQASFPQQTMAARSNIPLDEKGELLVEILEGYTIQEIRPIMVEYGLSARPAFAPKDAASTDLDDYYLIDVPTDREAHLPKVKKALQKSKVVEWVEENELYTLSPLELIPQKKLPRLHKRYGLNDPGLEYLWGFEAMKVNHLYEVLKKHPPQKKALLAILDTGVDADHEDISANYTSTQSKYDNDPKGHGTHCAGIAAAVSNNQKGIASFSQTNDYVQVTSIKVLSGGGFGTQKMIIAGILEAADAGADVLSLSLGGPSNDSRQRAYKKAVDYATKKGAVVVVAAGNSNRDAAEFAPANTPGVITVSAIDTLINRAAFSNTVGSLKMGVAAPGVQIYSTFPGNEYRTFNGTSMATPYVAGLVAVMKSLRPELTAKEAFSILHDTGLPTKSGKETGRLINPGAAVKKLMD